LPAKEPLPSSADQKQEVREMNDNMRVMTEKPLNAETPIERLRTWITDNDVFFKRNQGQIPETPVSLEDWTLTIDGLVRKTLTLSFADILALPKVEAANTLECSGNSRSLLKEKASGNPWTVGGVGNAVWGGVWLKDILAQAGLQEEGRHVCFEGFDEPLGKAQIKFVRSIPVAKARSTTLLAYEMNGAPLPLAHGFPLRALALGWTGANCVKWLHKITVLKSPFEGFFMDNVYRVFQKGEDSRAGQIITGIPINAIVTQPLQDARVAAGVVPIRGAAYAGEAGVAQVEISLDKGRTWQAANLIGLDVPFAWRHWEYLWEAGSKGRHTIMARATDTNGKRQPETARWNVLGYGNNGIQEHALSVTVI
jgi:DMSO/TMAO reductase YedYZ molybdopterin-dependent catalytic subunit